MKHGSLLLAATFAAVACVQAQTPGGGAPPPTDRQAAYAALVKACDVEIKSLCAEDHGRDVPLCLRHHSEQLSADCRDAVSKLRRTGAPAAPPQ
jgi:hypothetical protein